MTCLVLLILLVPVVLYMQLSPRRTYSWREKVGAVLLGLAVFTLLVLHRSWGERQVLALASVENNGPLTQIKILPKEERTFTYFYLDVCGQKMRYEFVWSAHRK